MKTKFLFITVLFCLCVPFNKSFGARLSENDSVSKLSYSFNADVVSRYIWRGLPFSKNPAIQPYASLSYKNLTLGAWGSYGLSVPYAEIDLYVSYTAGLFSFTVNDYFNEDEENDVSFNNYLDFNNSTTIHSLEGAISFNGTENFPLSVTAATFFYGNDKDSTGNNFYSTYVELAYGFNLNNNNLSVFIGGTVNEGLYANKPAIVNLGLKASRDIPFSAHFSMPVSMSLILNPYAKDIFFVFGITL